MNYNYLLYAVFAKAKTHETNSNLLSSSIKL